MAILGFELEEIARILALMEASDLEEIEWEEANRYLKVAGARTVTSERPRPAIAEPERPAARVAPARGSSQKAIAAKAPAGLVAGEIALVSPMVGVYYRSGKPGDPPLVEVGQVVVRDQPIGIIEAMKIFSEIPAEHGGTVVAVPAQDGQLVQAGTPLVIVKTQA
jgi:acetyl-CoA carboxylase biotin carboxyl carrier protein